MTVMRSWDGLPDATTDWLLFFLPLTVIDTVIENVIDTVIDNILL